MAKRLRVIQWATGNIGLRALRAVIEHPDLELAGLWVHSPEKAGQDAGTLCGLPPVGVTATNDTQAMHALDADCVLYMPRDSDMDTLCALLASGKNVVTTRPDFHHPPMMDVAVRARIEAACAAGGTSLHATGSSPGFVTEALTYPLMALGRRLDRLTIDEFASMESRNSPDLLFNVMGFGEAPGPFDERRANHLKHHFGGSLAQVAAASGIQIDRWDAHGELALAQEDIVIAAGTIKAGTVAAQRITVEGLRGGSPVMRFRANWYVGRAIDKDWALRESGWRVQVEGDTPVDVAIHFPVAPEDYAAFTPGLTAHRTVNAVRALCAAPPGIRTTADLPQIIAQLG
jgi:2,4-diaminopentanoate dehydrogenase